MKPVIVIFLMVFVAYACGGGGNTDNSASTTTTPAETPAETPAPQDGKGVGEIKEVSLNSPLKHDMVEKGEAIYEMKCSACHKLTDQRVVGPGWKGVTERRKPEWIMNMITNVEVMLEKDPEAQKLLEECLTRMPIQNMSVGDARDVLEFMYANDTGTEGK